MLEAGSNLGVGAIVFFVCINLSVRFCVYVYDIRLCVQFAMSVN
jgi:hypothetical protein